MTTNPARLRSLDGLRGLLALYILAGHMVPFLWLPAGLEALRGAVSHGLAAVEMFFVLSGMVILRSLAGTPRAGAFLIARAGRLLPVYTVALILAAAVLSAGNPLPAMPWLPMTGAARDICEAAWPHPWLAHLAAHLTMTQGLLPPALLPDAEFSLLGPAWSLSTEWQFYGIVATLLVFTQGRAWVSRMAGLFVLLAILGALLRWLPVQWQFGRAFLPQQAGYFALGIASFDLLETRDWPFYGLTIAAVSLLCVAQGGLEKLLVPIGWTLCLMAEAPCLLALPRALRWGLTLPPLLWLGAVSYPLYLIHAPLQRLLMLALAPVARGDWRLFSMLWGPPALLLSLLAAWALHRWVEAPCWRWSRRLAQRRMRLQ